MTDAELRIEGMNTLFLEITTSDPRGIIPMTAGIKDKDGTADDWITVGHVFRCVERVKAALSATEPAE